MGEMDTDTIGLIVLIIAITSLFIVAEAQKRKLGKMQRDSSVPPLRMRTASRHSRRHVAGFSDPPMLYGLQSK
jgi:hypothetical protein